ncbi:hypothetical protein [Shinella kummerowiae]|uniref:hypothetical protein n=1 Tax=Shinella kummerowiae TaxID=417745 RepID=UPI0021B5B7A5|nr:hypothetical protein [Shinella kummerowiae]MCT7663332.1 hypothetical protein [Shinella kummerowiae]
MKRYRIAAASLVLPLLLGSASAETAQWTEQEFQVIAKRVKQNPDSHPRLITHCVEDGYSALKKDSGLGVELKNSSAISAEEVVQEACRRLVKGIASSKITYDMYRDWMLEDGKMKALPDWR